jgi:hypothetical protein
MRTIGGGTVAIVQRSLLSPTAHLKVVLGGAMALDGVEARPNEPAWGVTSLDIELLPHELNSALADFEQQLAQMRPAAADDHSDANDPQARLERHFRRHLALPSAPDGSPGGQWER